MTTTTNFSLPLALICVNGKFPFLDLETSLNFLKGVLRQRNQLENLAVLERRKV